MPSQDTVKWSSLCLLLLSLCLALPVPSPADDGLLQQVDIGLLSIGGRAMYYDPKEGDCEAPIAISGSKRSNPRTRTSSTRSLTTTGT